MPFDKWSKPLPPSFHGDGYRRTFERVNAALYSANVETGIVYADAPDFLRYKLLVVPRSALRNRAAGLLRRRRSNGWQPS